MLIDDQQRKDAIRLISESIQMGYTVGKFTDRQHTVTWSLQIKIERGETNGGILDSTN